jgi:hypothetical protein
MAKNNALIRFYHRENPEDLSNEDWCLRVAELQFVLKYTGVLVPKQ